VHELSIAQSLIELACEAALGEGADRVAKLSLRIGQLSGVVKEALQFSFEIAAEGTSCEGAVLDIEEVAIAVMCPRCQAVKILPDGYNFCCPTCGSPTPEIMAGRELDFISLELAPHASAHS
jgi:hydrogenase nickel incorporation protein HypA/HybF